MQRLVGIGSPVHLIFIAAVALVVLGPKRLPEFARALGKAMQEFRDAVSQGAGNEGQSLHDAPQSPSPRHPLPTDDGPAGSAGTDDQPLG